MTTGTITIYGRTISTSARTAMFFRFGVIPLMLLSAVYFGYLAATVVGQMFGWGTSITALFLLGLTGQLELTTNGKARDVALLPKSARAILLGAVVALTLWTLAMQGQAFDFAVGLAWACNSVLGKLVAKVWSAKTDSEVPASVAHGARILRNRYGVEDVAFKDLA